MSFNFMAAITICSDNQGKLEVVKQEMGVVEGRMTWPDAVNKGG